MQRNSKWLIASRAVHVAKSAWAVYAALAALLVFTDDSWRYPLIALVVYYTWTRAYVIFYDWLTFRYLLTADGIQIRRGLISKSATKVEWEHVRAVATSTDSILRISGNVRVALSIEAADGVPLIVEAMPRHLHQWLLQFVHTDTVHEQRIELDSPLAAPQLRMTDYLAIGFTSGKFVLIVPLMASGLRYLTPSSGEGYWLDEWRLVERMPPLLQVLSIGGLALLGLLYGTLLAWLRYRGMRLMEDGNKFYWEAGALSKRSFHLPKGGVRHVVIRRNTLMRATGRAQVAVVLGGSDAAGLGGVVLAGAPLADAKELAAQLIGVSFGQSGVILAPWYRAALRVPMTVLLVAILAIALPIVPILFSVALSVGIAGALLMLWNSAMDVAALVEDSNDAVLRVDRGVFWKETHLLRLAALHGASGSQSVVARHAGVVRLRLRYRTQFARSLWIPACSPTLAAVVLQESFSPAHRHRGSH